MSHAKLLAPLPARRRRDATRSAPALVRLIDEIDTACCADGAMVGDRLGGALKDAAAQSGLLTAEQRLSQAGCYARPAIHGDPAGRFTIVAIVWGAGQFSPIHPHHAWCAYAVCEGDLQETLFAWDSTRGRAWASCTGIRSPGYGCYAPAGLDQIHRLGNPGPQPAISLHVYGVERERVGTHVNRVVQTA